jgi:hypothetical protein
MKRLFMIFLAAAFIGCQKEAVETNDKLVDLVFKSTNTPQEVSKGSNIVSNVKCYGPNLCYQFAEFEIKETSVREFAIRAKATFPERKDAVCAQALYQVDTTVSINAPTPGLYVLRFYHDNSLFKADTVQVK